MKELREQIKNHDFQKVYLITGDEAYLIRQAKILLKAAMVQDGDEMNCAIYEDNKVDLRELNQLAMTYPFFSEKRLIIMDRTGILKSGKDEFVSILDSLPESTCILICEPEVDKRSKVYKWIKKNGFIKEFLKKDQTEKVLVRWIATMLSKEKKQIRESDVLYFLERVGDDMFQIKSETDKLCAYVGEKTVVEREDIEAISSGEVQNKIFDLTAAIARGDKTTALRLYNDLIILKEPPMHILFLIVRQYRILLIIKNMRNQHKTDADIASVAGIPRFSIRKNESQLRGYDEETLEKCIERCIQIEEDIKTGRIGDQLGVELLIVGLSGREK